MGLSASQARFLQLTARKSNVEYQVQQISFERLQIANKLSKLSTDYNDKMSNRKMIFTFNDGDGLQKVDVTYNNYKNYMNQQLPGVNTSQAQFYLVSSSGEKIVVASEEERAAMIEKHTRYLPIGDNDTKDKETTTKTDENGNETGFIVEREFNESDFIIVDDLDDNDNFQNAIQNGTYYFAQRVLNPNTKQMEFQTESWDVIGAGAITEVYDTSDDAKAEAEYKAKQDKLQLVDKKLEMEIDKLETERGAIDKELDSVKNVIKDNIDKSFKTFG